MKVFRKHLAALLVLGLVFSLLAVPYSGTAAAAFSPVVNLSEPSTLIGTVVRTWGTQFALSSAAEWNAAQNMDPAASHVVPAEIVINNTIGFESDPTALAAYRRDERGALTLAPGVLTATYETVPFAVNDFTRMVNSFGADAPEGTWIEVWVRVGRSADDLATISWLPIGNPTPAAGMVALLRANPHSASNFDDGFLTSGRWSPFSQDFNQGIRRTFSTTAVTGGAQQSTGSLIVSGDPANVVQYRITLHRGCDTIASPVVRNVHGSTRNEQIDQTSQPKEFPLHEFPARNFNGQEFPGGNTDSFPTLDSIFEYLSARPIDMDRQGWDRGTGDTSVVLSPGAGHGIYMQGFPMRSQQATGPVLGGVNCSAVTMGMIVNGFLDMEGIEPLRSIEEVGLNLFDYQLNGFGNWQFTVAGAGTYGLRAHVEYNDRNHDDDIMMETILRHLLSGHALGLSLTFSSDPNDPHFIPRTDGTTGGHLIVLLGVVQRGGNWYVITYEPWSGTASNANDRVYREFPMQNLINAMRHTGATGSHNIIYVVKPGVEPGAGTAAPIHLDSYLVQVGPGEFALSTDGTAEGIIPIGGMDRGQIGGPSGFVGYTVDPDFSFMGTTITDPHGQAGTRFRYLPLGNTIRFGYDAHTQPVQPFTFEQLTDPNFRMYVWMGNGFTHVIDASRVPTKTELYPELRSPGGEFRVDNFRRTVAPLSVPIQIGKTTIGALRAGLQAVMDGQFAIFPEGTLIDSVADFLAATPKADAETLSHGDFIVAVNSGETLFVSFAVDYFGLAFEHTGVNEAIRLNFYDFTREGSPGFYPWSNPLTGWSGSGRVVYTAHHTVSGVTSTFPEDMIDTQVHNQSIRAIGNSGIGAIPIRFVDADPDYMGGFRLIPYSTTGEMMPWRQGIGQLRVKITATIEADDPSDPFHGEQRSFYVEIAGATGGVMSSGNYVTGHLTPSFTWGTFAKPVVGERAYNLTFFPTDPWAVLQTPLINVTGRPPAPVPFPYVPYENDRPYWVFNATWAGSPYNSAQTGVNWFIINPDGSRSAVPLDENHGFTFQVGNSYQADLFLATNMNPSSLTWMNLPSGEAWSTFVSNIAGLPTPGEDGISDIVISRSAGWRLLATLTFEPLTATVITVTPDVVEKVYGTADPAEFTYTVPAEHTGKVTGTLVRAAGEDVGEYAFSGLSVTDDNAYVLAYSQPDFVITPAPLTVRADNKTKHPDGQPFPVGSYTVTITGLVGGETKDVLGTVEFDGTAITAVNPGTYTIIPKGLSSTNYDITFVNGTLTMFDPWEPPPPQPPTPPAPPEPVVDETGRTDLTQEKPEVEVDDAGNVTQEKFVIEDKKAEEIKAAVAKGATTVNIRLGDTTPTPDRPAPRTNVTIPPTVLAAAAAGTQTSVAVTTPHATLTLPPALVSALAAQGQPLTMVVDRPPVSTVVAQLPPRATPQADPVRIETAITGRTGVTAPMNLQLPVDAAARKAFLDSLRMFAIHSDGETGYIHDLTFDIDESVTPPVLKAVSFFVDKFSTFTLVEVAPEPPKGLVTVVGERGYTYDGKLVDMVPTYYKGNDTMMPIRMLEAFGMVFVWSEETKTATMAYGDNSVQVTIGSTYAYINGVRTPIRGASGELLAPELAPGRTMVPLRFVSEHLGFDVLWETNNTITIRPRN